jgi:hypothetical protein
MGIEEYGVLMALGNCGPEEQTKANDCPHCTFLLLKLSASCWTLESCMHGRVPFKTVTAV